MVDLVNFWTGASTLPTGNDSLLVKFDAGSSTLPLAETCFRTIVLATEHSTYDEFRKNMDIALKPVWIKRIQFYMSPDIQGQN